MKNNLFAISLIVLINLGLCVSVSAQTIRRVNTMPGLTDPTVYTTVQAAHDASVAGDIIYVEPAINSTTTYPAVIVDRRITLIGTGFDLALNAGTSADKRQVGVSNITLSKGSSGSKIIGLTINEITVKDANCRIERNKVGVITLSRELNGATVLSTSNNTMIYNNRTGNNISGDFAGGPTNCTIMNNICVGSINNLTGANISKNTIQNNNSVFNGVSGSSITANIFDTRGGSASLSIQQSNSVGNTFSNNLCTTVAALPAGNGNVNSANAASVFKVADPWAEVQYLDSNVELSPTSPALTVGTGGTPIGAFSGNTPYVLAGLPNIPIITDFSINNVGNANSPLQVNVKARSNN